MNNKGHIIYSLLFLLILPFENFSQEVNVLLKEAQQLESSYKDNEALQKYLQVLRLSSGNLTAICRSSELYSKLGKRQTTKEKQKEYFKLGKQYGEQAVKLNPNSADANFVMALAMGRMAIVESGQEKIKAIKDIKRYAEKCVQLDPSNFKGYHILGKWHYEVSDLSAFERWLLKLTYGALPHSSLAEAIRYYEKSKQINPDFLLNYLELAKSYHRNDNDKKAVELLQTMLKLPNSFADDASIKAEGKKLLDNLK